MIDCSAFAGCCNLSEYTFTFLHFSEVHLFSLILSVGIFGASLFIIIKLLKNIIQLNNSVNLERSQLISINEERSGSFNIQNPKTNSLLPFYYAYLFIASVWLLLQGVSLAMIKETFGIILGHFLQDGHGIFSNQ